MSERANGLDAEVKSQPASAPEQAQTAEDLNAQSGSWSNGTRQQHMDSAPRPRTQTQTPSQPAPSSPVQQAPATSFTQPNGMFLNQRAAQRHRAQTVSQAAATPQPQADQQFGSASVATAMSTLLKYQNDSGEDVGGMFASPEEISPEGLNEYADGSGFVG